MTGCEGTRLSVLQEYNQQKTALFSYEIIDNASVTEKGMKIFKAQLDDNLKRLNLVDEAADKVIEVICTHYYMRHEASRALLGAMAGSDNITSMVLIKDKETGDILAELKVVSKNPTILGSAQGLIKQQADKITDYIRGQKS
ncbi:hypothetical protein [Shewanella surugensis]|uniref:DUF3015 domain-containing protein n=1 Tax=Shewanella surugensis TaxID=212020 RepID=A0ABT0LL71_9GAMM|nr:hypothetical protein [Shewanella surugensis]MCL1128037.1 hypothetical protein [Shewanella surugensis]